MNRNIVLVVLASFGIALFLFNYQSGLLGPYGTSNDIYHELILALTIAIFGLLALLLMRRRR